MNARRRWILYLLTILLAGPASAQRHFFGFDNNLEGWTFLANDDIVWDGTAGVPPGSLKVTASIALSPCLPATPGGDWHFGAMVFANGSGCMVSVVGFDPSDCSSDGIAVSALNLETRTNNEWVDLTVDYPLAEVAPYFRILAHPLSASSGDYCYFDNVEAIGPLAPPLPVPTLDATALLLLAALLAAAGVLLVRRTRG